MTNNIGRLSLIERFRLTRTIGDRLKDRQNYTADEFIKAAKEVIRKNPNDWRALDALGDKYQEEGMYADSLRVLGRSVELKLKILGPYMHWQLRITC